MEILDSSGVVISGATTVEPPTPHDERPSACSNLPPDYIFRPVTLVTDSSYTGQRTLGTALCIQTPRMKKRANSSNIRTGVRHMAVLDLHKWLSTWDKIQCSIGFTKLRYAFSDYCLRTAIFSDQVTSCAFLANLSCPLSSVE